MYPGLYFTQYFYRRVVEMGKREHVLGMQTECTLRVEVQTCHSLTHMLILDQSVKLRLVRHAEDHSHTTVFDHVA